MNRGRVEWLEAGGDQGGDGDGWMEPVSVAGCLVLSCLARERSQAASVSST